VRSFIEADLFDNNVPFDNTTPIYVINLLWKLGLGLGLELQLPVTALDYCLTLTQHRHLLQ